MKSKFTKELLEPLVRESISVNQVCKRLGKIVNGGSSHRWISKKIKEYQIDTSHFLGQHWARGKSNPFKTKILTDEIVFVKNSKLVGTKLRKYYLKKNFKYICNVCGLNEWLGNSIKLHLDHINGISNDNRLENLRWICPNCHQQTETWGFTNK